MELNANLCASATYDLYWTKYEQINPFVSGISQQTTIVRQKWPQSLTFGTEPNAILYASAAYMIFEYCIKCEQNEHILL